MEATAENVAKKGIEFMGRTTLQGDEASAFNLVIQLLGQIGDGTIVVIPNPERAETPAVVPAGSEKKKASKKAG